MARLWRDEGTGLRLLPSLAPETVVMLFSCTLHSRTGRVLSSTDGIWNLHLKGTEYTTDCSSHLPRLRRAPHADTSLKVAVESQEV